MASDAWTLSTHEFRLLWEADADTSPYPTTFAYGGGEMFDSADDRRLAEQRMTKDLHQYWAPMKAAAFAAFARPTLSVDVIGARLQGTSVEHFRAHGAWRGQPEQAFLAVQTSTPDITIGGDVSITAHDLTTWSASIAAALPPCTSAGHLPTDTGVPTTVDHVGETTLSTVAPTASAATAAAAFSHLAPVMGAVLTMRAGAYTQRVTPESAVIHVADIDDDGRYALVMDTPATALGADTPTLARLINKVFNTVRHRHAQKTEAM